MTDLEFILSKDIDFLVSEKLTTGVRLRKKHPELTRDPNLIKISRIIQDDHYDVGVGVEFWIRETKTYITSDPCFNDRIPIFTFEVPWSKHKIQYRMNLSKTFDYKTLEEIYKIVQETRENLIIDLLLVSMYFKEDREVLGTGRNHSKDSLDTLFKKSVNFFSRVTHKPDNLKDLMKELS